jgi:hypothetical protein
MQADPVARGTHPDRPTPAGPDAPPPEAHITARSTRRGVGIAPGTTANGEV